MQKGRGRDLYSPRLTELNFETPNYKMIEPKVWTNNDRGYLAAAAASLEAQKANDHKVLHFRKKFNKEKGITAREWGTQANTKSPVIKSQRPARMLAIQLQEENAKNFKEIKKAK